MLNTWENPDEYMEENENHLYFHPLEVNTLNMSEYSSPGFGGDFISKVKLRAVKCTYLKYMSQ